MPLLFMLIALSLYARHPHTDEVLLAIFPTLWYCINVVI